MVITIAIVVVALAGVVASTSLGDSVKAAIEGPPGGHGQAVDGIPCESTEQLAYHVHAHLTILDNGNPVTVPAAVGIAGGCTYWLHTHDASGLVHVEAPSARPFTLGQFFDIWGQPLSTANVAGHRGHVTTYVNQQPFTGDPRTISLEDKESIVLEVGKAVPPPPNFDFSGS